MAQRLCTFVEGEYYHIYNRGVDKRTIFVDDADRQRFVELLFLSNSVLPVDIRFQRKENHSIFDIERKNLLVRIGVYCLMPNHFHILLTPAIEGGVAMFMQKILTGYSMYFNKKYDRQGILFEGRFKAEHVYFDEYLKYLFSYIHLNPVKLIQSDWKEVGVRDLDNVKKYLNEYKFSSLLDYFGNREESCILDKEKFPSYFVNKTEIDTELLEWLRYKTLFEEVPKEPQH